MCFFITMVHYYPHHENLKKKKKSTDSQNASHLPNVRVQGRLLSIYFAISLDNAMDLIIIMLTGPGW